MHLVTSAGGATNRERERSLSKASGTSVGVVCVLLSNCVPVSDVCVCVPDNIYTHFKIINECLHEQERDCVSV